MKRPSPYHADKQWLYERLKEGLSRKDIAKIAGAAPTSVGNWCKRHNLTLNKPGYRRLGPRNKDISLEQMAEDMYSNGFSLPRKYERCVQNGILDR